MAAHTHIKNIQSRLITESDNFDTPPFEQTILQKLPVSPSPVSGQDHYALWYQQQQAQHNQNTRQKLGQVFTPQPLCDLMIKLADIKPGTKILDPACGTGMFLLAAAQQSDEIYGVEVDPDAALISAYQLWQQKPEAQQQNTSIFCGSFFDDLPDGFSQFDVIIGNPPYVRHELIPETEKLIMTRQMQAAYAAYLEKYPQQQPLFEKNLDLYLWFYIRATQLLKPGGRLVFVSSNSWMNTQNTALFLRFLDHHYQIVSLTESACERWFSNAATHAVITVLEKKHSNTETGTNHLTRLIRLTQPVASPDTKPVITTVSQQKLVGGNQPLFSHIHLGNSLNQQLHNINWCALHTLGSVHYPVKTGINPFFYVDQTQIDAFGIEPEFLIPVLKSAKSVQHYQINPETLSQFLFYCPHSKDELNNMGKTGALNYILWGETQVSPPRQKRAQPTPWPMVASVQNRRYWYQSNPAAVPDIICNRFFDQRFFFATATSNSPYTLDQTFYSFKCTENTRQQKTLLTGLLNSTLCYLMLELYGRKNLGQGVLQFSKTDMANLPVLNPAVYTLKQQQTISEIYTTLSQRPILAIDEEIQQADRMALDLQILEPFELSAAEIYDTLHRLVTHRRKISQ